MTVLFDFDSLIYRAAYRIASFSDIRKWFRDGRGREWMEKEIIYLSVNRLTNMYDDIYFQIEETGIEITDVEYYITMAKNSKRKEISSTYKAQRKRNKWVNKIRRYLISMEFAIMHDEWEADDLIADRANELGEGNCLILSIDKDMKQIPGIHYNYQRVRVYDEEGNRVNGDFKGLDMITPEEANRFFWEQMLIGDGADNIKGVPRIGPVKAGKLLNGEKDLERIVKDTYFNHYGDLEAYEETYFLLRLGTRRG